METSSSNPSSTDAVEDDLFDEDGGSSGDEGRAEQSTGADDGGVVGAEGDDSTDALPSIESTLRSHPPPDPLPPGWFLRASRSCSSSRGAHYYYFNQDTGECRWDLPGAGEVRTEVGGGRGGGVALGPPVGGSDDSLSINATAVAAAAAVKSILKRKALTASSSGGGGGGAGSAHDAGSSSSNAKDGGGEREARGVRIDAGGASADSPPPPRKKSRGSGDHHGSHRGGSDRDRDPKEVRVLHILKKHRGSRRPASWRNPKITDGKEKAITDLEELISILKESEGDPKELRATFEELAKTESDCSSAKRGGDLGFFGKKKMQPAFEKASFGLKVGELSDIVDTSSGVHVILRLA